jgi:hypothetical protein
LIGNSIPKIGCHYFWPELIALPKNTLPIMRVDATRFRSLFIVISTLVVGESRKLAPIPICRELFWWRLGREKAVLRRDLWLTRDVDHCWAGIRNCIKPFPYWVSRRFLRLIITVLRKKTHVQIYKPGFTIFKISQITIGSLDLKCLKNRAVLFKNKMCPHTHIDTTDTLGAMK